MNRKAIIISILAIMCLAVQGQVHYRLEGTIGDSTLNTKLQLYQHMSPMEMINAAIDTLTVVGGKLIPAEGTLSEPGTFNLVSITENGEEPEILSFTSTLKKRSTRARKRRSTKHSENLQMAFSRCFMGTPSDSSDSTALCIVNSPVITTM